MADINIGRALSGLGAAFKNEMPAFMQQVRQEDLDAEKRAEREMFLSDRSFDRGLAAEDRAMRLEDRSIATERANSDRMFELEEKRKETLFKDTAVAKQYFKDGNISAIIDLYADRVDLLRGMGINTSNSERMLSFAQDALSDPNALSRLNSEINTVYDTGRAFNVGMGEMPSAYRSLDLQAQAAGFPRGSSEYQRFMRFGGGSADEGAAKTEFFENGAVLEKPRNGPPKLFVNGQQIVDPEEFAIQMDLAVASGPLLAGETSQAQAMGGADAGRIQEAMNEGISAAEQIPNLRDALDLLDLMETGGINQVKFRMNRLTGITPADEGELNYLMSKNVLGQLKTIFGAAFTAQEGQLLRDIEANEGQSTEVNKRLIARALAALEVRADRGTMYATDLDRPMVIRDIEGFKNRNFMSYYDQQESSSGTDTPPQPDPDIPALNSRAGEDEMRRRGLIE